ncbi:helix-turn-helix domain-containing protein [Ventrimonas sp. CLA-AP-H27]|uniref:Helix-turn-helix domain-containing protein n=1 Tax=Ventrimonas faecis TaxID=3133170 RepID=A0ABV1HR82_9FIRM
MTIKCKIDILGALKEAGYSSHRLRNEKLIGESAIQAFRKGRIQGIRTLDVVCGLLQVQPGDILEYVYGEDDHVNDKEH